VPGLGCVGGAENQLLAKLVYSGGAHQRGVAGNPEVVQDALDRTGGIPQRGGILSRAALARRLPRARCRL
jgi:hypothetical protein